MVKIYVIYISNILLHFYVYIYEKCMYTYIYKETIDFTLSSLILIISAVF